MFQNSVIKELLEEYKPIAALSHASGLMAWDLEVNMPEAGAQARGFSRAQISLMSQRIMTGLRGLLEKAERERDLNDHEKGMVRVLKRDVDYYTKVPPQLLEELRKATTEASIPWREARKKSDFHIFKPHLEEIIELKLREAEKLGFQNHPFNALLDLAEEGLTISDLDNIFSKLIPGLKRILAKVTSEAVFTRQHTLEDVEYNIDSMKRVNKQLLRLLNMPERRFRMDVSIHPFTSSLALDDVRITTRYEGKNFKATMFSVIHESGHALYELQVDPRLEYTPVQGGVSSAIHESQSRFWENVVGRGREFVSILYPILKENLSFVSFYDEEQIYIYFNTVRASMIRVDADELTYNFHIALRYELEKRLLDGSLSISDLPSAWNNMMEEYLGITPKNDSEGVLQDVHWSGGILAGFQSYSLGNVIDGMIWHSMIKEGLLGDSIQYEVEQLKSWLREKIHRWGAVYSPKDLLKLIFGEEYNPERLIQYLEHKYSL